MIQSPPSTRATSVDCHATVWWRDRHGVLCAVLATGWTTWREALVAALASAACHGYTRPRWWELGRWSEPRYAKMLRRMR